MGSNNYIKIQRQKLANQVISAFNKRHFESYYAQTKEDALSIALSLISKEDKIAWGGSMSIIEIGLLNHIINNGYNVINRDLAVTAEEKAEIYKQSLLCDTYIMGTNAISKTGELVNIDCVGNRVAALLYGPKNVIIVAGINKIVSTFDDAIKRARQYAAPINIQRVAGNNIKETPCFSTGYCSDCFSKDSICSNIVITRLCFPEKRIKVILVNEDLGF